MSRQYILAQGKSVMYASKIIVKSYFLVTQITVFYLFLDILVIVYVNLTSKVVIFKRLSKGFQIFPTSLLIHFCKDYRPYSIYWQVSSILFSITIFILSFVNLSNSVSKCPAAGQGLKLTKCPAVRNFHGNSTERFFQFFLWYLVFL